MQKPENNEAEWKFGLSLRLGHFTECEGGKEWIFFLSAPKTALFW